MQDGPDLYRICRVNTENVDEVYDLALQFPELNPYNDSRPIMSREEFHRATINDYSVCLCTANVASQIIGFIHARIGDTDTHDDHVACIFYVAVLPEYQGQGIAHDLHEECLRRLKERNITHVYSWANPESGIIPFFQKHGYTKGKPYVWMDRHI